MGDFEFQLNERKERLDAEHQRQKILAALGDVEKQLREEVSLLISKAKCKVNKAFKEMASLPTPWEYSFRLMMQTLQRNPRTDLWNLSYPREHWSDLMHRLPLDHRLLTDHVKHLERVECNSETSGRLCSFCKQREYIISMEIWIPNGCVMSVCEDCHQFANGVLDLWQIVYTEQYKEDSWTEHYKKVMDAYLKIKIE